MFSARFQGGDNLPVDTIVYDKDREFVIFRLGQNLEAGKLYIIKIHYTALLNDNLKGFYRSTYSDQKTGKEEIMAVSQFQIADARRAVPCFDEPGIKAKYEVSLGRRRDMSSISNMPIKSVGVDMVDSDDYVWDHYQESVKMSSYLVAFVVSKFQFRETTRGNGVRFRIWSVPQSVDQTQYAREIGPKILEFFEDYFNVKFPLPKQDMIAVPDFSANAMENWGLIVYREASFLYKEGVSAASSKQSIAKIVSHELAHQWFGNLVTPSWWTDLWLNEGFATYVQYLGVEAVQPELKYLQQFVTDSLQDVLQLDALESSHPVSVPVGHPDEISEIFDKISYGKGASIIRMMDKFLTTNTFKQGLTNYLTELKFAAAEQDDLWGHLTDQAHKDGTLPQDMTVKTIMDTWTLQLGFPVVTVARNYQEGSAMVSQQRFSLSKSDTEKEYGWWIPITFVEAGGDFSNTYNDIWMGETEDSIMVPGMPARDKAVVFNVQETGYYRVNYDLENWRLLASQLQEDHTAIHVINRAQMIDDALNLAKSGLLSYSTALSLTGYLSKEVEYVPWVSALTGLAHLDTMLKRTPAYGDFKRYMLKLINPIYTKLGFNPQPGDSHLDILLREKSASWACRMGNTDCKEKARDNFAAWMEMAKPDNEESNPVDVNMKYVTYCNAISDGSESEWDFAWSRFKNSQVASEKLTLLKSLGCSKEVWLLNRFLNMSLTPDSGVRKQDGPEVIGSVAANTIGRDLAFDFVRDKWSTVKEFYGKSTFYLKDLMKSVTENRNTLFGLYELKTFSAAHQDDLGPAKKAVEQAIEGGEANLLWVKNYQEIIWTWLKEQNKNN